MYQPSQKLPFNTSDDFSLKKNHFLEMEKKMDLPNRPTLKILVRVTANKIFFKDGLGDLFVTWYEWVKSALESFIKMFTLDLTLSLSMVTCVQVKFIRTHVSEPNWYREALLFNMQVISNLSEQQLFIFV